MVWLRIGTGDPSLVNTVMNEPLGSVQFREFCD
jgi:hypothetical protein